MPDGRTRAPRRWQNIYDVRPNIDTKKSRQRESFPEIIEGDFWECYEIAKPYSMLHVTGFYNLYVSMRYLSDNNIPGDLVECGVMFGGASIFAAMLRERLGMRDRTLHLFDTFAGFPDGSSDVRRGRPVTGPRRQKYDHVVVDNFEQTVGTEGVRFHVGKVEETLDHFDAPTIALLRLDTDYYPSTRKELDVLYPHLVNSGVLIIDDYGNYEGARRATDELIAAVRPRPLLMRVDGGIWAGVKPGTPPGSS